MKKRKKRMKNSEAGNLKENALHEQIKKLAENLFYVSETDAEILPFVGKEADVVDSEQILKQTNNPTETFVEEKKFDDFFSRLTEMHEWFGEEEKQTAQKFSQLRKLLEQNLKDIKVFKVGKIQIDIYAVGLDGKGKLTGIQTKAVET